MSDILFSLNLTADEYLPYYQGVVKNIQVISHDGRTLRFPANVLRPFVTHGGVQGTFVLEYDQYNKFKGIRRVK
ncbi:MAG: DUF2835 family protein [Gammaproteobacteria bacterium]|nr:MAG: DUF2835 family protein [Gammaproteobacteria bacterium]